MKHMASILLVALVVTACSAGNSSTGVTMAAQHAQATNASLPADQQMPALAQQRSSDGAAVQNDGSYLHGAYNGKAPMMFPDNSNIDRSKLLSPEEAIARLHAGHAASVEVRTSQAGQATMLWSQVQTGNITPTYISGNRLVYEVVTSYTTPFTVHGNTYSSGQRTIVVDAQTGQALYGKTTGTLTSRSLPFIPTPTPIPTPSGRPSSTPNPCLKNPRLCEDPIRTPTPAPTPTKKP